MPWSNNKKIYGASKLCADPCPRDGWKYKHSLLDILFTDVITKFLGSYSSMSADQSIRIHQNDLNVFPPWITQEILIIRFNDRREEELISAQKAIIDLRKVNNEVIIYGQSEDKFGEKYFHQRVLKEFRFDVQKTNWPEAMTLIINEYRLIQTSPEDDLKRKLLCTSKYNFYHDEDEEFSCKLWLQVIDETDKEIVSTVFRRRDSENLKYWDTGDYLPEERYVFDEVSADVIISDTEDAEEAYVKQKSKSKEQQEESPQLLIEDYFSDPRWNGNVK